MPDADADVIFRQPPLLRRYADAAASAARRQRRHATIIHAIAYDTLHVTYTYY